MKDKMRKFVRTLWWLFTYLFKPHDGEHKITEFRNSMNIRRLKNFKIQLNSNFSLNRNSNFLIKKIFMSFFVALIN